MPNLQSPEEGLKVGLHRFLEEPGALRGARVGLLAHAASVAVVNGEVNGELRHAVDLVREHSDLHLVRLFGPEHGLYGAAQAGETVTDTVEERSGVAVVSLYGARRAPGPEHLQDLDALLVDLQDVGLRCYTYLSTLKACLRQCAVTGTRLVVLERPNPLGRTVAGPGVAAGFESFVSTHDVPFRHGQSLGELARWFARDLNLPAPLVVASGWRGEPWAATGLPWVAPSPNLPTLQSARCYGATVFLEGTNLSEGRGTQRPFEQFGAPWLDADALSATLNGCNLPGVRFEAVTFIPTASKHAGVPVFGSRLVLEDTLDPLETAAAVLQAIYKQAPERLSWLTAPDGRFFTDLLYGSAALRTFASGEVSAAALKAAWRRSTTLN